VEACGPHSSRTWPKSRLCRAKFPDRNLLRVAESAPPGLDTDSANDVIWGTTSANAGIARERGALYFLSLTSRHDLPTHHAPREVVR